MNTGIQIIISKLQKLDRFLNDHPTYYENSSSVQDDIQEISDIVSVTVDAHIPHN